MHLNLENVFYDNMKKVAKVRKNNCIVNSGDNATKDEIKQRILQNKKMYGLKDEEIKAIKLPVVKT